MAVGDRRLAAAAGAAAILALEARAVARHQAAAFRTERRVGNRRRERQRFLRALFGHAQRGRRAGFIRRILSAQELLRQPAEDVIHDGLAYVPVVYTPFVTVDAFVAEVAVVAVAALPPIIRTSEVVALITSPRTGPSAPVVESPVRITGTVPL